MEHSQPSPTASSAASSTTRSLHHRPVGSLIVLAVALLITTLTVTPADAADAGKEDCRVVPIGAEHQSLPADAASIERLYRALFLRRPDNEGLRYWSGVLHRGEADLGDVAAHFAASSEFTNRYGNLSNDDFVDLLYCNVLGRRDGGSGAAYWRAKLSTGLTLADAVLHFSQSTEFVRRSTTVPAQPRMTPSAAARPTTSPPPTPPKGSDAVARPTLVWADEFDTFDAAVWRREHSTYGDGNGELQCYRPENVSVAGGVLILRARTETYTCPNGSTRDVTSAMVRGRVDFDHGQRIEFRVKLNPRDPDDQRGLWPALWASSWNGGGWPRGGEVDWLEYVGREPTRAHHTIHYLGTDGRRAKTPKSVEFGERFSNSWHVITFDWTDDLVWYIDGREVQRIPAADIQATDNPFLESANAITQIKLNLAIGGSWGGALGPTTLDAAGTTNFAIDYVRVYDLH